MMTLTTPKIIKTEVAKIERTDNLEIPHTPWPEVQPLPRRVPKPTKNPAKA